MKKSISPKSDYLFEVSWEVCNQVGGIYAVLKSKAINQLDFYGDGYCFIGPYFEKEARIKFEKEQPSKQLKKIFNELKKDDIQCHLGRWSIGHKKIKTILIDFKGYMKNVGKIKEELHENFDIDPSSAHEDYDAFVAWATTAGMLLQKLRRVLKGKITAHFHEYISGASLLYLKKRNVKIATVFTTHATILGRTIAAKGIDLYNKIRKIDPKKYAYDLKIQSKYLLELACVKNCNVFTTVSTISAIEAKYLLGKEPNIILPNGLDIGKYPALEERAIRHNNFKRIIEEFLQTYFSPYYKIDLHNSLLYFISGRYEFKNKGIDIFIEALSALNKKLNSEKSNKTIIAFICIPTKVKGINNVILENKNKYQGIEYFMDNYLNEIKHMVVDSIVNQKIPSSKKLFPENFRYQIKKKMIEFKRKGIPPIVTHDLVDMEKDIIMKHIKKSGLNNSTHDHVKVIYYPVYLSEADGLINLGYNDFVMGCHLGVFPSYYEPWGYTPVEAGALGVPFITTDLAGFGRHIIKTKKDGFFVLKRHNKTKNAIIKNLTKHLYDFAKLDTSDRLKMKLEAKKIADDTGWEKMIVNYIKAHNMALSRLK